MDEVPVAADPEPPSAALAGVRVLDLSRVLAGPWASQLLGDLGAEVIKVEKPGVGDDTRGWGPPFLAEPDGATTDAAYFLAANRNKKSVAIDIADAEGAGLVRRLAERCHVVIENFKVGGLARYGLDWATLSAINPALVYCSITGFVQTGPASARPGYDFMIQAIGGLMSVTGQPDGAPGAEPMKVGVAIADLFAGLYASNAILAALRHAERTGQGQHIDVSLYDCQVAMLANQAMNYLVSGQTPTRLGNAHPNIAPYQVFAARDGHLVIAVGNDSQFGALCRIIGAPEIADDPRFATNRQRVAHRQALVELIAPAIGSMDAAPLLERLEAGGVPAGPIRSIDQVFEDPLTAARNLVSPLVRSDGAGKKLLNHPVKFGRTPAQTRLDPPRLGAHTDEIIGKLTDGETLLRLKAQGVIG